MKNKIRALLFIPQSHKLVEFVYDQTNGGLDQLYELIDCNYVTVVEMEDGHSIFVDDEGLLKEMGTQAFTKYSFYPEFIAGNAVVVGPTDSEGNCTACTLTAEEFASKIQRVVVPSGGG